MLKRVIFIKNAVLLTVTALILRGAGMLFRVYLSGEIGAEGMGLYQLVFSIHILGATLATSGLSVAVTRLVTEQVATSPQVSVRPLMSKVLRFAFVAGLGVAVVLFLCADWIAALWMKDTRALLSLRIVGFSMPFMSMSACLQGYFVACRRIKGTSTSQLLEQTVRMVLTYFLLEWGSFNGLAFACFAVVAGNVIAELCACLYLYGCYARDVRRRQQKKVLPLAGVRRRLAGIALPIAATGGLGSLLHATETMLVPACLVAYSGIREQALAQMGMLKGMAMPVLFFPSAFLAALSMLLLPEISEASSLNRRRHLAATVGTTLHITLSSAILIGAIFLMFAKPLAMLLYQNEQVGWYIAFFAPLMPIMYLESIVDGILKGLNQQMSTFRYSMLDSGLRIALTLWVVPKVGMIGFLLIMAFSNLLTSGLNTRRLLVVAGIQPEWGKWVGKPVLCGAGACLITQTVVISTLPPLWAMGIGSLSIAGLYVMFLMLTGGITKNELYAMLGRA